LVSALGRHDESANYLRQALAIDREVQDRKGEGIDLGSLGEVTLALGRLEEAESLLRQSLTIRREVHERRGEARVLRQLAQVAEAQGNLDPVEAMLSDSLAIAREVQARPEIANSLLELGRYLIEYRKDTVRGCEMLRDAIRLYADMRLPLEIHAREIAQRLGCSD
jgi:tetratricopeptide (TPR) repeat protein